MDAETVTFEVAAAITPEDRVILQTGLVALTQLYFKVDIKMVIVLARDADGGLIGGLIGRAVASWMSIDLMFIEERFRRRGIGTTLLAHAETAARGHGCLGAHVTTGSFEAPGFYERMGYTVYGGIEDYPPGHTRLSLSKRFAEPAG